MEDNSKRLIEELERDFHKLSSKGEWTREDIEWMKDLQKLMYYIEVRCAMKEGSEYPGSDYMERDYRGSGMNRSYGGYNSYSGGRSYYSNNPTGRNQYSHNMSGRRYYDSERDKFMNDLHRMMDSESNPEVREAMENVARMLEMK